MYHGGTANAYHHSRQQSCPWFYVGLCGHVKI